MNEQKVVVFITAGSNEEAEKIGNALVGERLAACCSITDSVTSIFRWEGKINNEKEHLLIVKSTLSLVEAIVSRVKELHSYDVPEIIALPVIAGSEDYLRWIDEETKRKS